MSRCPIDLIANVSTTRDHCAGPGTEHCAPDLCSDAAGPDHHVCSPECATWGCDLSGPGLTLPIVTVTREDLDGGRVVDRVAELMGRVYAEANAADLAEIDRKLVHGDQTRYESHQWGGGETGEECVACGVQWQDCEAPCPPPGREVCSPTCGLDAGHPGDHWPEGVARSTGQQR